MVAGYAMSGCKESHDVALPTDARKAAQRKAQITTLSRRNEKYLPHMVDWIATYPLATLVGTTPASALAALNRMEQEGLIEVRRKPGPKGGAAVRCEWKVR